MKVGIDLSSTNTGLVILSDDNKLVFHGNFQMWDADYKERFNKVADFVRKINDNLPHNIEKLPVEIGIELADFKNANITNRFNLLAGMVIFSCFYRISVSECYEERIIKIKLFNSNEWQQHLGLKPSMERQFRKDTARQFTKSNCLEYQDTWTEDECDAYCIAYFLEKLRDRTEMHQEVKARDKAKAKSEKQALRDKYSKEHKISKLKDIVIKYKSMEKLTKAQQRALEKAEMELKEYENNN